jgi:Spy/CpxP family protein refolding chaperone
MKNWKAIAGVCLVFILGGIAGGLGTSIVIHKRIQHILQGGPKAMDEIIARRLTGKLDLTPGQQARIKSLLDESRGELAGVRREMQPEMERIFLDYKVKIRDVLTPDQQKKFDEIVAANKGRWQRFR